MSKLTFTLLFGILFATSCMQTQPNKEWLFNKVHFNIAEGESFQKKDDQAINLYESYLPYKLSKVPLLRYIKHEDYNIFLGLPFRAKIDELRPFPFHKKSKTLEQDSTEKSNYRLVNLNDNYLVEYIIEYKANTLYLLAQTTSKEIAKNVLDQKSLNHRFTNEN